MKAGGVTGASGSQDGESKDQPQTQQATVVPPKGKYPMDKHPAIGLVKDYEIPAELKELPSEDLCVFIDPLDGTREFVDSRLDAVQNLIGISYRGRPVAGVVGLPFPDRNVSEQCCSYFTELNFQQPGPERTISKSLRDNPNAARLSSCSATSLGENEIGNSSQTPTSSHSYPWVLFGVVESSSKVAGLLPRIEDSGTSTTDAVILSVSSSKDDNSGPGGAVRGVLATAVKEAQASRPEAERKLSGEPVELFKAGASGNKLFKLLTGQADVSLLNLKTCRWDTAAPCALLETQGCKLTNLFGNEILHKGISPEGSTDAFTLTKDKEVYRNLYGVLATGPAIEQKTCLTHKDLMARIAATPTIQNLLTSQGKVTEGT